MIGLNNLNSFESKWSIVNSEHKGRKINRNGTYIGHKVVRTSFLPLRYTYKEPKLFDPCVWCGFSTFHEKVSHVCYCCVCARTSVPCASDEFHLPFDLVNSSVKITKQRRQNPIRKKIRSYLPFKTKANSHKREKLEDVEAWKILRTVMSKMKREIWKKNSWQKTTMGKIPVQTNIL